MSENSCHILSFLTSFFKRSFRSQLEIIQVIEQPTLKIKCRPHNYCSLIFYNVSYFINWGNWNDNAQRTSMSKNIKTCESKI